MQWGAGHINKYPHQKLPCKADGGTLNLCFQAKMTKGEKMIRHLKEEAQDSMKIIHGSCFSGGLFHLQSRRDFYNRVSA